jgi:hypothetical protein
MPGVGVALLVGAATLVGVLEDPQCKPKAGRSVRVLFEKQASGWVSLVAPGPRPSQMPRRWTVAFDGKSLGAVGTTDPGWQSEYPWTYPRDRVLVLDNQTVPTVANRGGQFAGWCDAPPHRPLVVVNAPRFTDPARWKRSQPANALRALVFPEFKSRLEQVFHCPANAEQPLTLDYAMGDLQLLASYADRRGRRLVAVSLDRKLDTCDGPTDTGWWANWYLVSDDAKKTEFIGDGLSLVDAGDYDGDGHSEVLFWYSGYNRDGYVMFAAEFRKRIEYLWNYH